MGLPEFRLRDLVGPPTASYGRQQRRLKMSKVTRGVEPLAPDDEDRGWLTLVVEIAVFGVAFLVMACVAVVAAVLGANGMDTDC